MKEITLSVNAGGVDASGNAKDNVVVLTAKFATHEEAVAFHDQLGRICSSANKSGTGRGFSGHPEIIAAKQVEGN